MKTYLASLVASMSFIAAPVGPAQQAIVQVFGAGSAVAIKVARCESRFDPRAVGRAGERGLFQIHPVHFHSTIRSPAGSIYVDPRRLFEPKYNARVAWVLSRGGTNWRPWTCA